MPSRSSWRPTRAPLRAARDGLLPLDEAVLQVDRVRVRRAYSAKGARLARERRLRLHEHAEALADVQVAVQAQPRQPERVVVVRGRAEAVPVPNFEAHARLAAERERRAVAERDPLRGVEAVAARERARLCKHAPVFVEAQIAEGRALAAVRSGGEGQQYH